MATSLISYYYKNYFFSVLGISIVFSTESMAMYRCNGRERNLAKSGLRKKNKRTYSLTKKKKIKTLCRIPYSGVTLWSCVPLEQLYNQSISKMRVWIKGQRLLQVLYKCTNHEPKWYVGNPNECQECCEEWLARTVRAAAKATSNTWKIGFPSGVHQGSIVLITFALKGITSKL